MQNDEIIFIKDLHFVQKGRILVKRGVFGGSLSIGAFGRDWSGRGGVSSEWHRANWVESGQICKFWRVQKGAVHEKGVFSPFLRFLVFFLWGRKLSDLSDLCDREKKTPKKPTILAQKKCEKSFFFRFFFFFYFFQFLFLFVWKRGFAFKHKKKAEKKKSFCFVCGFLLSFFCFGAFFVFFFSFQKCLFFVVLTFDVFPTFFLHSLFFLFVFCFLFFCFLFS